MRRRSLTGMMAAAVTLAGCGATHTSPTTTSARTGTSAATTTTESTWPRTPRTDVQHFARAYAAYLDGQVPARQLTGLTGAARSELGPPIAGRYRVRRVAVESVTLGPLGAQSEVVLDAGQHKLPVKVQVVRSHGRDVVASIQPPDLDSIVQGSVNPVAAPPGSARAEQAARTFLAGYLAWDYGHGKASEIKVIASGLARQFSGPPPVRPGASNLHPQVVAIGMQRTNGGWIANVNVHDDVRTYDLELTVLRVGVQWEVSRVRLPS